MARISPVKPPVSHDEVWAQHITRLYPEWEWQFVSDSTPYEPSAIKAMKMRQHKRYLGLCCRDRLMVSFTHNPQGMDKETLLFNTALTLQGFHYLEKQSKEKRYARALRGPKADISSMRTLLRADIFVSLLEYSLGDKDSIKRRARMRTEALLTARHGVDPSLFALPIASDTIAIILSSLKKSKYVDRITIQDAYDRAEEVARCIDTQLLSEWYGFGQAAQDMAWRGASKRSILGAAALADAPHIRTLTLMISEITNLKPHAPSQFTSSYSSFCDAETNLRAHEMAMDQEFEWVLSQDPLTHGSKVFIEAADRQIDNLKKGQVSGWCANALHGAAKTFDDHGGNSKEAIIAARQTFDETKAHTDWEDLNALGESIVQRCCKGLYIGLRDLYELAQQHGLTGLQETLDSKLILAHAHENTKDIKPVFATPALRDPTPVMPVHAPAIPHIIVHATPPTPSGMGGGGGGSLRAVSYTAETVAEEAQ